MKNRYIPFGYQIQNGDSVINTEQAATVQHIFYAYTEGQSFKEIAEYLTTSGTAYHFSDNSWNKNIVARILANEIYCGAKGYPAIISKEVYSQAASIRSNKTVTYSAVLKPFRSDMQCACCGERLYWRPRTQQWTCRQCGMWSIVSRQLTNANDTKAAITANMPYPNDWSAETVAALISGLLGTSTAENKSFGDASIDSNTEQNFAVIHRQSRKKNCIRLF